jgi:glutathionyl-hydroquinone reductase
LTASMLVEGEWKTGRQQEDEEGRFIRLSSAFRSFVTADGSSGYKAEPERYHLYISWACPWAHRTAILRKLKGSEGAISLSVVHLVIGEGGWAFSDAYPEQMNGASYLREIYTKAEPTYTGRVTTPVLWDKKEVTIFNNESREIMRMLGTEFEAFAK